MVRYILIITVSQAGDEAYYCDTIQELKGLIQYMSVEPEDTKKMRVFEISKEISIADIDAEIVDKENEFSTKDLIEASGIITQEEADRLLEEVNRSWGREGEIKNPMATTLYKKYIFIILEKFNIILKEEWVNKIEACWNEDALSALYEKVLYYIVERKKQDEIEAIIIDHLEKN